MKIVVPAGKVLNTFLARSGFDLGFRLPVITLDFSHHIQKFTPMYRIASDVTVRAEPLRCQRLPRMYGQTLKRRQPAPRHDAGKFWPRRSDQFPTNARMQSIGTDQKISRNLAPLFRASELPVSHPAQNQRSTHRVGLHQAFDGARHRPAWRAGRCDASGTSKNRIAQSASPPWSRITTKYGDGDRAPKGRRRKRFQTSTLVPRQRSIWPSILRKRKLILNPRTPNVKIPANISGTLKMRCMSRIK